MVPPDEPRFAVGNVGIALVVGFSISVFCVLFCVMSCHLSFTLMMVVAHIVD